MELGKRRVATTARNGVVSGSIWESRMKSDQVKGGIKVFNGDEISSDGDNNNNNNNNNNKKFKPKLTVSTTTIGKRKTWKSAEDSPNQIQIARQNLDSLKNVDDEQMKEINGSADDKDDVDYGINKFSLQTPTRKAPPLRKTRSDVGKDMILSLVDDGIAKTPIRRIKSRFEESTKEVHSPVNKIPIPIPIIRKGFVESGGEGIKIDKNPMTSGSNIIDGIEKNPFPSLKSTTPESNSTTSLDNGLIEDNEQKPKPDQIIIIIDGTHVEQSGIIEIESDQKLMLVEKLTDEKKDDDDIIEEKEIIVGVEEKSKQVLNEVKKKKKMMMMKQIQERTVPVVKKQIPSSSSSSKTKFNRVSHRHNRLQSLVDLVMWIDVSKSAFVFGFGTFTIISSSYTKDVNISLISVVSYLGLVYLAVIFMSRSIIRRGIEVADDDNDINDDGMNENYYVIGEEEAMWLMRKILPYLNELLLKLRALFSGDPATTMKLAVMLYVLARCGSSITIWKMIKFGFIGIFTVPKICSSYSTQFTAYGNFWFRRFRDAWVSCTHKKAVSIAIFTLIWNLSSVVARCWALFMLFVAFRYYKESSFMMNRDDEDDHDEVQRRDDTCQTPIGNFSGRRVRSTLLHTTTSAVSKKEKKRF